MVGLEVPALGCAIPWVVASGGCLTHESMIEAELYCMARAEKGFYQYLLGDGYGLLAVRQVKTEIGTVPREKKKPMFPWVPDSAFFQYMLLLYVFFGVFKGTLLEYLPTGIIDPTAILYGSLMAMWLFSFVSKRSVVRLPCGWYALAFLVFYVLLSSYWSPIDMEWAFTRGLRFGLQDVSVMFLVLSFTASTDSLVSFLTRMRTFLVLCLLYIMVAVLTIPDPLYQGIKMVPIGSPPIAVSYLLSLLGIFLFVDVLHGSAPDRVRATLLLLPLTVCLLVINERGPVYAMGVAMLVSGILFQPTNKGKIVAPCVAGLLALLFILLMNTQHLGGFNRLLKGLSGITAHTRLKYWRVAVDVAMRHPLVGGGPGAFLRAIGGTPEFDESPHNVFFEVFAEYGLLGGLAFLGFIGAQISGAWSGWRSASERRVGMLLLTMLVYILVHMVFSSRLSGWRVWWLLFGAISLYRSIAVAEVRKRLG